MKINCKLLCLLFTIIGMCSCKTVKVQQKYMAVYNIALSSVESPKNAKLEFGGTKIVTLEESDSISSYKYEDKYMGFTWIVYSDHFAFSIQNHSGHSIRINWDDISYVNHQGYADRVIHKGIKYNESEKPQGSISIPNKSRISDVLVPVSNIYQNQSIKMTKGLYASPYVGWDWSIKSLIPCYYDSREDMMKDINNEVYIGKNIQILFPVEIEGVKNDYLFEFTVKKFK